MTYFPLRQTTCFFIPLVAPCTPLLANIENNGQHPSLQIFFELMLRYHISVDKFLLDTPPEKDTKRRQLDALLDGMSDTGMLL